MPLGHVLLAVPKDRYDEVVAFYVGALEPLGYKKQFDMAERQVCGLGAGEKLDFWIAAKDGGGYVHIAFAAKDQEEVHKFHESGLAAGGRDNGAPGPRPLYGPTYYGSFLLDPVGNNIEAVYR